jgi:hypothetical protein
MGLLTTIQPLDFVPASAEKSQVQNGSLGCVSTPRWQELLGTDSVVFGLRSIRWKDENTLLIAGYLTPLSCQKLPGSDTKIWRPEQIRKGFRANLNLSTHWTNSTGVNLNEDSSFIVEINAGTFFSQNEINNLKENGTVKGKKLTLTMWGSELSRWAQDNKNFAYSVWSIPKVYVLNFEKDIIEIKEQKK